MCNDNRQTEAELADSNSKQNRYVVQHESTGLPVNMCHMPTAAASDHNTVNAAAATVVSAHG